MDISHVIEERDRAAAYCAHNINNNAEWHTSFQEFKPSLPLQAYVAEHFTEFSSRIGKFASLIAQNIAPTSETLPAPPPSDSQRIADWLRSQFDGLKFYPVNLQHLHQIADRLERGEWYHAKPSAVFQEQEDDTSPGVRI